MTTDTPKAPRKFALPVIVSALVIVVGLQAWYMAHMKQQLDALKAPATTLGQLDPGRHTDQAQVTQSADAKDPQTVVPEPLANDDFNRGLNSGYQNPYEEFKRLQREMDRRMSQAFSRFDQDPLFHDLFNDSLVDNSRLSPEINIKDEGMQFVVRVDLPGADKDHISVKLDNQLLTVSAMQNYDESRNDINGNPFYRMQQSGTFSRSITLPEPVKPGSMHTEFDNNELRITITKAT